MKKVSLLRNTMMVSTVLAMISCGNEDPIDPRAEADLFAPASVVESLDISRINFDGEEFIFTYDADGKLDKVTSSYSESDEWGTWGGESEYSFTYSSGKLTSVVETGSTSQTPAGGQTSTYGRTKTITYAYNSDELVSGINREYVYVQDGQTDTDSWSSSLEYNTDKQLMKETSADPEGSWKEWQTFEWNAQNIAKQAYFYENTSGGRKSAPLDNQEKRPSSFLSRIGVKAAALEEETIFSDFDDKGNPLAIISVLEGYYGGLFISKNNVGKVVVFNADENGNLVQDEVITLDLEYDSKGRPTKYTITETEDGEADGQEIIVTYKN